MKSLNPFVFTLLLGSALLFSENTPAIETPNSEIGLRLFQAAELGSNGKSCAGCHPEGKGLDSLTAYDDDMLREMINFCIRDAQKGVMLPTDSQEIESLLLYLRSLPQK